MLPKTTECEVNMKKIFIIALVLLTCFQANTSVIAASGSTGNNKANETPDAKVYLYPFEHNGIWGYMDKKGNVKIEPKYNYAYQFSDRLALISKIKGKSESGFEIHKYGFINANGEEIIPIVYDYATSFKNGNAVIEKISKDIFDEELGILVGTRYWIKPNCKYLLKEKILDTSSLNDADVSAYPFSNGLALIASGGAGETHYIDTKGNTVFQTSYEGYGYTVGSSFNEGLAVICTGALEEGAKYGYINTKNKIVISPKFENAGDFSEGIAPVCIADKWGYINEKGEIVIPLIYDYAQTFSEGIAAVNKNGKWGFIDKDNNFVITPQYKNVDDCVNGLVMVKDSNGKFLYYVDKNNKKIEPKI